LSGAPQARSDHPDAALNVVGALVVEGLSAAPDTPQPRVVFVTSHRRE